MVITSEAMQPIGTAGDQSIAYLQAVLSMDGFSFESMTMTNPYYPTGIPLIASPKDLENFIRECMKKIEPLTSIRPRIEVFEKYTATILEFYWEHKGIFVWAYVVLCDYGEVTTLNTMLNSSVIRFMSRNYEYDDVRQLYQQMLDELKENIRERFPKPQKPKQKRGAQDETMKKIEALRELREKELRENGKAPTKQIAMHEVKISRDNWRTNAPELYKNWYIKSWRPED